jgi:hypothetical protein
MPRPKIEPDDLASYSRLGPPIVYSPTIEIPLDDPLLVRLVKFHGADVRREFDDLTAQLKPKGQP